MPTRVQRSVLAAIALVSALCATAHARADKAPLDQAPLDQAQRLADLAPRLLRQAGVFTGDVQVLPDAPKPAAGARATDLPAPFTLVVRIDGRDVLLMLEPIALRAPNYTATVITDGVARPAIAPPQQHYAGVIAGLAGSAVRLSVVPTGVRAMIDLGIDADGTDRTYFLQPAADLVPRSSELAAQLIPGTHVTHRADQLRPLAQAALCGGAIQGALAQGAPKGSVSPTCVRQLELAVEADFPYYEANGSVVATTIADIESIINIMALIYQRDLTVIPVIVNSLVRETADPYTTTAAGTLLGQFRSEWLTNRTAVTRDLVHLFTGRNLDGSTIGIAYLNAACGSVGFGVSQARFTANLQSRVGLVAHEIGHNLNASHCEPDSDCAIMCSGLGGCSGNLTRFGARSVNSIRSNLPSEACLTLTTPPTNPVDPRAVNDAVAVAGGGTINIDPLINDFDGNCQAVIISAFPNPTPRGATVTRLTGAGPNGRDLLQYVAPVAFTGTDPFNYTITDGARTATATITVTSLTSRNPENPPYFRPSLDVNFYAFTTAPSVLPNYAALTPYLTTIAANINIATSNGNFSDSGRADNVGAVYTGFVVVPTDGLYTLFTESDDGSRLFIGTERVVNNDGLHGMVEQSGAINLRAGRHALRVEFFEAGGGAGLIVRWQGPGVTKAPIPAANLVRNTQRCTLSDVSGPGVLDGFDGELTADDVIFFINRFTANSPIADIGGPGGSTTPDGERTADDIILFIGRFTTGC